MKTLETNSVKKLKKGDYIYWSHKISVAEMNFDSENEGYVISVIGNVVTVKSIEDNKIYHTDINNAHIC